MTLDSPNRRSPQAKPLLCIMVAVVLAIAIASAGSVIAQEMPGASDSTDISISVLPGSATPVVNPPQPAVTPAPESGSPRSGWLRGGTVSARFVLLQANTQTPRADDAIATMVIRDDRGTAAGWTIALESDPAIPPADSLALLENLDGTVWRIVPADGRQSDQVLGISSGHTVGVLSPAIPFLQAALGSGSGVFQQNVLVIVPGSAPALATLTVLITTSP